MRPIAAAAAALALAACSKSTAPSGAVEGRAVLAGLDDSSGIVVTIAGPASAAVATAADGSFRFDRLPPGAYAVTASAPSTAEAQRTVRVTVGSAAAAAGELSFTPVGRLVGKATLVGATSHAGVTVAVAGLDRAAVTREDGTWAIEGVRAGKQTLIATRSGFSPAVDTVDVAWAQERLVAQSLSPAPTARASVFGFATTVAGDAEGIEASLCPAAVGASQGTKACAPVLAKQLTAPDGRFRFENLEPGIYSISLRKGAFRETVPAVLVQPGSDGLIVDYGLLPTSSTVIELQSGDRIRSGNSFVDTYVVSPTRTKALYLDNPGCLYDEAGDTASLRCVGPLQLVTEAGTVSTVASDVGLLEWLRPVQPPIGPVFTPDEQRVVYVGGVDLFSGAGSAYVLQPEGTKVLLSGRASAGQAIAVSADSSRALFVGAPIEGAPAQIFAGGGGGKGSGGGGGTGGGTGPSLLLADLRAGTSRALATGVSPSDYRFAAGDTIAYAWASGYTRESGGALLAVTTGATPSRTDLGANVRRYQLSKDGRSALLFSGVDGTTGRGTLSIAAADGSAQAPLGADVFDDFRVLEAQGGPVVVWRRALPEGAGEALEAAPFSATGTAVQLAAAAEPIAISVAPDGASFAFRAVASDGTGAVFAAKVAPGAAAVQLSTSDAREFAFAGPSRVAIRGAAGALYTVPVGGGEPAGVEGGGVQAGWKASADGTRLAYRVDAGFGPELRIASASGIGTGAARPGDAVDFQISADGRVTLFTAADGTATLKAILGAGAGPVVTVLQPSDGNPADYRFAADGQIAIIEGVTGASKSGTFRLARISSDGVVHVRKIASDVASEIVVGGKTVHGLVPTPDANGYLFFSRYRLPQFAAPGSSGNGTLTLALLAPVPPVILGMLTSGFSISPDKKRIAVASYEGASRLLVAALDGTAPSALFTDAASATWLDGAGGARKLLVGKVTPFEGRALSFQGGLYLTTVP